MLFLLVSTTLYVMCRPPYQNQRPGEDWEGILSMYINIPGEGVKMTGPDSSVVSSNRTRGKLRQRKSPRNMRESSCTVKVAKRWHRLPWGAVESPSLKIFKTHLDAIQAWAACWTRQPPGGPASLCHAVALRWMKGTRSFFQKLPPTHSK